MGKKLLNFIINKEHHVYRKDHPALASLAEQFSAKGLSPIERMTRRFELLASAEEPVLLPDEEIAFMRTVKTIPDCFTPAEWDEIRGKHYIHELGYLSNLCPNYIGTIKVGLLQKRKEADAYGRRIIDAILDLSDRYRAAAVKAGKTQLARVLTRIPRYGAQNFREALQFFRILHFSLWLEGNYHNTIGRFDQYMYPYLKADLEKGLLTCESALALLEDFFLSFNKDSDLYPGVQQGDNGQSMMLGGVDSEGRECFNLLSQICLEASGNNLLIDPKINLRVSKNTPVEIFAKASELTKAGLGFPQYSNDDVVIPGLLRLGYDLVDARNYTVAACWEFIIPGVGADVANIEALSFAQVMDEAFHASLPTAPDFDSFFEAVKAKIHTHCATICEKVRNLWFVPSPLMNVLMDCEIYSGGKYNNYGIHGSGIATAADSLAAIKKYVFDEKSIAPEEYIVAVDRNFKDHPALLHRLRYEAPKLGNNDKYVDEFAVILLDTFADALQGKVNDRGGCFRAGTGSAMFYLRHVEEMGASPDGRRRGEPLGTNFSVSLFAKVKGPVSVIGSMTKPHFERAINGGPLTLEFHQSLFVDDESVEKVAGLVKAFIDLGGHQLQLNVVNAETLRDAQLHPERYRQLVVRIWGWSAYFVELDRAFQDHVIARQIYSI